MRYDTPIFFQRTEPGEYDATSGNYGDDKLTEEKRWADITDSGSDTLNLVYGGIKQGSLTVRIQRPYKKPFNFIRIGDKTYRVDLSRRNRAFVVSEVQ